MKKFQRFLPFCYLLIFPIFYIEKNLHGSMSTAITIAKQHGFFSLLLEMFTFSKEAILLSILLILFVRFIAPSLSMFVGSLLLLFVYHLFFTPLLFFKHISIFLLVPLLHIDDKNYSRYLFYSLYYIVTLAVFSSFRICYLFYGYNTFREILLSCPLLMMILLAKSKIYPSKPVLFSLFPLILLPLLLLEYESPLVSSSFIMLITSVNLTIFATLYAKTPPIKAIALLMLLICLPFIDTMLVSTALFSILAICLSWNGAINRSNKIGRSVINSEVNPFFPSLKFYNEVLGHNHSSINYIHKR